VTSRAREHLALRMQQGGLDETWFEGVFAYDEQPAPKPDPRCFEPVWLKVQRPGLSLKPAIYVGDRRGDGEAARAAGIAFVAVLTGPEVMHGFPFDLHARDVLDDVTHLVEWLDTHGASVALQQAARCEPVFE
jgi:phosphoglycolate phosphatase